MKLTADCKAYGIEKLRTKRWLRGARIIVIAWAVSPLLTQTSAHANPLIFWQNQAQQTTRAAKLVGRVVDAQTGEPVAKVKLNVATASQSATTDERGEFALEELPPGDVELSATTVGYALRKRTISLRAGETINVEIALSQEAATLKAEVNVTAEPFATIETNPPSAETLNKTELAQLSSVIVRDPLRAAQALPSTVANDDFRSEFAVRGAGFDRVGVYLDGVLTDNFVYTAQGDNTLDTGSLSIINADTIESIALYAGAFPAKYGYSSAAVLNLETRAGNRVKPTARIGLSVTNVNGVVDGPFADKRGSYLFSARRSFVGYIARRIQNEVDQFNAPPIVEFADAQGKAIYNFNARHQISFAAIYGDFNLDINRPRANVGVNSLFASDSHNLLANFAYTYTPSNRLFVQTRLFRVNTSFINRNPNDVALDDGRRTQTGARGDINYELSSAHRLEAGTYLRSVAAKRSSNQFIFPQLTLRQTSFFDERSFEQGYYAQDTYTNESLHLAFTGGGRLEHSERTGERFLMPRASLSVGFGEDYRLRAGFGRYYQVPDFVQLYGILGNSQLKAELATHYNLSLERAFGNRTRLLAEAYDREDRRLPFSLSEPRLTEANRVTFAEFPFRNSLNGHARGLEISVQRRSANGFNGFASYAYARTRLRDSLTNLTFPNDFDQRHTLNFYGNYRFTDTFSLSGQWRYGSGLPIPGFFQRINGVLFLAPERNRLRLPAYSRVDVRASKVFLFNRFKLTLTGEVLNALNRHNLRYTGFDGYGARGRVFGQLTRTLPVLPSAGIVIEF